MRTSRSICHEDGKDGRWNASLLAGATYFVVMIVAAALMPSVNEVPADFPAVTLWAFRMASLGAQAILWTQAKRFDELASSHRLTKTHLEQ